MGFLPLLGRSCHSVAVTSSGAQETGGCTVAHMLLPMWLRLREGTQVGSRASQPEGLSVGRAGGRACRWARRLASGSSS
eukprot:3671802-Alexandrium_andersonii.AAC.1